jgi:hypothetical protein
MPRDIFRDFALVGADEDQHAPTAGFSNAQRLVLDAFARPVRGSVAYHGTREADGVFAVRETPPKCAKPLRRYSTLHYTCY